MHLNSMMKIVLPLVVWLTELITWIHCKGGIGFGIKREIFFLNLEDGYFGCQVNQSTDVLQLYELSKLCDGNQDCYQGSDELARELKCTNNCVAESGLRCQNGACLDSQCHCNDGFGGCSCEVPDENECKYRPCDVFAHCTNTLGSFHCSCFPGYAGDGFHCQDINECDDPAIASRCVPNAECCNLPAHFLCKCKPGFEGDGEVECRDINECAQPNICGHNAVCSNTPGNYTCNCLDGYHGNPFNGCLDVNECELNACGAGALCTNFPGGFHCECPPGFSGDAYRTECQDVNECLTNPCGVNALCKNIPGSYQCSCPPGYIGDPFHQCTVIGCASHKDCPNELACVSTECQNPCVFANPCNPPQICQVKSHQPVCIAGRDPHPGPSCDHCPPGVPCNPETGACGRVTCYTNLDCSINEVCLQGVCQLPCSAHNPCAQNAVCVNTNHGPDCSCIEGYHGNGFVGCIPVESYKPICQYNEDCPPDKLCDRLNRICINPCFEDSCGENAECVPKNHKIDCRCPHGSSGNPYISCTAVTGCRRDEDCASTEACVEGKCGNPCRCGPNAVCDVIYHRASCKCLPGYNGNPHEGCRAPKNPCEPNPCGMHAQCELDNGNPVCFCPKGMTGNPFKQCIPEGADCTPNPCGPHSGCRVVQGSAVCFCLPEFEGDPPLLPCHLPKNPCNPSPCGPNTQCTLTDTGYAKCTCLEGYVESQNTIRGCVIKKNPCDPNPCGYGAICDPNRTPCCFCPESTVGNPYKYCGEPVKTLCLPGPCGHNSDCYVTGNTEQCFCKPGFQGDPYTACQPIPSNPCSPNPCGPYATCTVSHDGHPLCNCPPGIVLDSNGGCTGFECTIDEDCPFTKACVAYKCQDPCPGSCGIGATCRVEKHHPVCTCNHGLTGNPLTRCYLIEVKPETNPCTPYPCGPNTYCKINGKRAVCTCMENFIGDPKKGCQPECVLNTDCGSDKVCINYQCRDPCGIKNVCGLGAVCLCRDHMPTCICREGYAGNPFIQCVPKPTHPPYPNTTLPCAPSPCDPTNACHVHGGQVAMCDPCSGPNSYYNPACHPECLYSSDCPFNLACLGQKCLDPCVGSCGIHALCTVVKHTPICSCPETLTGNPYEHCSPIKTPPAPADHCHRERCGANAICKNNHGYVTCECIRGYFGNPYLACRPECVINTDCPQTKACLNNKCVNPCVGVCGIKAECQVINHQPICYCPQDFTGDPSINCYPNREYLPPLPQGKPENPCDPSPCGAHSRCLISPQGYATCSCIPGYRGSPPFCKPECVVSTECALVQSCINQKCANPCPGTCGIGAQCFVINHNPICGCPPGHVGDPFVMCVLPPVEGVPNVPRDPCDPNPCGPNSICQVREGHPVCSCVANYLGSPPYCRPECVLNQECPFDKACIHEKCQNPCTKSCGLNAKCDVVNHTPYCTCLPGYEGDAFISCSKIPPTVQPPIPKDPCYPTPCGENAQCSVYDGTIRCTCIPPYIGNPYTGACRPECVMNSDCPPNAACLSSHCRDPCPGVCGINAECTVVNHIPVCTCFPDHIGDPFQSCRRKPITPPVPKNPCEPSPCGPNSRCEISHSHALCSCNAGFIGEPPNCRPECVTSAECSPSLACIYQKCSDPCPGTCGLHARCTVVNHNPICSCPPNTVGDPFVRCVQEEPRQPPPVPYTPCHPSPCGANAECKVLDDRPVCSCLAGMLGTPPYCRPECLIHADCPTKLACLNNKCRDPCIGSCGFNAQCTVVNHQPICSCHEGFQGDPFSGCNPIPPAIPTETPDPCHPSPCGSNAVCKERNGAGSCQCLPEYSGDPYTGCRPECVLNSECPHDKACVSNKCVNPCIGVCGTNAECRVINHSPSCSCVIGYTGNPLVACHPTPKPQPKPDRPRNPCIPSPCGPYSECRQIDNHAVCSCQKNYVGSPPACRPECMVSSECPQNKACIKQKCQDPCVGTCGYNARCQVVSHNPICSCSPGFTGDPFVRCVKEEPTEERHPTNPCIPSPCGPNAHCRDVGGNPACSCLENYIGRPPNCRPECTINEECPPNLACQNERCRDPCVGSCGVHATCVTVHHVPHCNCETGYTGDPFAGCIQIIEVRPPESPQDPCVPSPCGANAVCKQRNGAGSCICMPEYFGDPYTGCRPECVTNSDCDRGKACFNNKCKDPCVGTCGLNAECRVINHSPSCTCLPDYVGDPINACHPKPKVEHKPTNPCIPSPCGPYSECRRVDDHAVCSCQKNYIGSPPACRPECMVSTECPQDKACIKQTCQDPCPGTCSPDARCQVVNHNPICSCRPGFTGDPFVRCIKLPPELPPVPSNPCIPSPCGPYSECKIIGNTPACSCQQDYVGRPPNCRPECTINAECAGPLACIHERCKDPCPGSCGIHAICTVSNHAPRCTCENGYTGDPFAGCSPVPIYTPTEAPKNPCVPSPCGANAVCKERNGAGSCICQSEYFGDPYTGCRPECVTNSDCDPNRACVNNKCKDPCPGTCGLHAECRVINHAPSCSCAYGYTGDPISACQPVQEIKPEHVNPCLPSPCGPYSDCREINGHAVCSCQKNYIGTPPACRPECMVSSECAQNKACINQKCADPCVGTCGQNARCQVVNHNPICSCPSGYTGDPFVRCIVEHRTTTVKPSGNPCVPSPCGPYSDCRVINNVPACSCLTNYIGQPPNCRPECVINAECPSNLACKNERCVDPCPGSCSHLAKCYVINHNSVCTCPPGYTGNALVECHPEPTTERLPENIDPCRPNPCGVNAECIEKNEVAACRCITGYFGDPYSGCKRECETNNDCTLPLACIGYKCVDPCPGTCGSDAICTTVNHIPICSCPPEYTGDPFFQCRPVPLTPKPPTQDPCYPSPCGPNSHCRPVNQQAVCTCLPTYVGSPPNCRPECVVSSECPSDKACINQRCADPCPNTCGLYALCNVRNHNPYCSCPPEYTGDPFARCSPIPPSTAATPTDAPPSCYPSPCGPHSQCKIINGSPVCSCLPDFVGSPPSCRPECVISSECASQLACINQHCRDPCPGSCGVNANCHVLNHVPVCTCNDGHTGDPFNLCSPIPITTPTPINPCSPSPCGPNAVCHGDGICECIPEYTGNPYESCRPECVISSECQRDKACIRNKCQNPCSGTCGINAKCDVINHIPTCSCPSDMTGDPFTSCRPKPEAPPVPLDPCSPTPCGPNSICRNNNGQAVCSCLPSYQGSPPSCRPECIVSEECSSVQACVNKKCINPCVGICGYGARCEVINHSPICSCREGQTGDPFRSCYDLPPQPLPEPKPENPCVPPPCGPNAQCLPINGQPTCSCYQGFVGAPPNCRPECVINSDCPRNLACINNKCKDPCPGSCGLNAQCQVISNTVSCSCLQGYVGNPFEQCVQQTQIEELNPCEPSPCGANAVCKQQNGAGSCSCIPGYQGNPYEGCRPECVLSSDCPSDKACIRNKCQNPCPGICGTYASCTVINHVPNCNCEPGYIGDPFNGCRPKPTIETPPQVVNPCTPSPCGPNSKCIERNDQAICTCLPNFQGAPPDCRPECVVNSECPTNRACYKYKCTDPCPGTCGVNARCEVIKHRPICSCPAGTTGDPFQRCYQALPEPKPPLPPVNPCVPSPCGPHSECHVVGSQASCRCRENYIGLPPNCRPECVVNTDCSPTLACISEKCRDPCIGSCGLNAECRVHNHIPTCTCIERYTGDPFTQCTQIIYTETPTPQPNPCNPSPCGANANCNNGACTCVANYFGDPYVGCRPECTMNTDCSPNKACINLRCVDPCIGICGQDARCDVVNHIPTCSCPPQTSGDAFVACRPIIIEHADPCNPSPCGQNSICRVIDGHAVCSCQPGLIGAPPSCRPECVVSSECSLTQACLMNKCRDPCPGTCGLNAKCNVINHNPICSCPPGYNGDPFRHCQLVPALPPTPPQPSNPCAGSPCGPNAICQVHGDLPACSCLPNYIGSPPNCRPECTINPECPPSLACISQRCGDPCIGSCGFNAVCTVTNHVAVCSCIQGYTGDPFASCALITEPPPKPTVPVDPCYPSPCGPNARCRTEHTQAICECLPEYQGNPYEGCRPECLISSDCAMNKACIRNKCQDPCPGTCGLSAICSVSNHIPICYCPEGTTGDAFRICEPVPKVPIVPSNPCYPSPCGPNTNCRVSNNIAVCECIPGFEGSPTTSGCHPECVINADCPRNRACVNNKCVDPCPGVCGYKAVCQTLNHSPVCSCQAPLVGDPFVECKEAPAAPIDPCNPSPCGRNGQCRVLGGVASCTYPECIINQDCSRDKACFGQKCKDPCVGACGINAICQVVNHDAACSCPPGYYGEPRLQCRQETAPEPKPECVSNSDCSNNKACINHACRDPCAESANVCAVNAECRVQQHRPYCFCKDGLTGNPQSYCYEIGCRSDIDCLPSQACVNRECTDPCAYTQCGNNALCRVDNNHKGRCHCPETYFGNPLVSCERPQCISDPDCPGDLACINQKCQSPCNCAPSALCTVIGHKPNCRCPPGYTGNPYTSCTIAPIETHVECKMDAECSSKLACFGGTCKNPCLETKPCGANAECSVVDTLPLRTMTCLCLPGYVGDADVQCRKAPEKSPGCVNNDECSISETCVNRRCINPCAERNPCAPNANCLANNHRATCKCPEGLIGDPFTNCYKVPPALPECTTDSDCPSTRACINEKCQEPCTISNPCGIFAECNTVQHRPVCNCPDGWAGNPQVHCYKPECKSDSDCLYDKACRNYNCVSPCALMSCGIDAQCIVQAHVPQCVCPTGTQGNPLLSCVSVGCQYNEDCADHEACDRLNRKCRPVCESDTCAEKASCTAKKHQPICICLPGTQGDPYIECNDSRMPQTPECVKDTECPSKLACINQRCQNPCQQAGRCSPDQECTVLDTYPVRTVMCICPPDTIASNDGHCKPIVPIECKSDSECNNIERCVRGSCIEACRIDPCGRNAICSADNHYSVCSCPPHYFGNPHVECTNVPTVPMPPTLPECSRNDDCPFNLGCINQRCISPCTVDGTCGRGSFCHVQNHQAVCRCPPGYSGNPAIECIPPTDTQIVGCVSNSECSPEESCINKNCVNPCNCGPNADCRVIGHYPMCYCRPGYSGNPQYGCVKVGCESDDQCSFDKTCYNGDCVNPCLISDPCAITAQCYGDNHRAACKCPPSYKGDPFVKCEPIECQIDANCPQDRMCIEQHCVNPCTDLSTTPCAPNAICYVRNHATGCRCPDYLPIGNPLSFCERAPPPTATEPECRTDSNCPSQKACIREHCVNPCVALTPCTPTAKCNVLDSVPVRTLTCTCPEGWIPNKEGECRPVVVSKSPGCDSNDDCPSNETCINRVCRNPCDCGLNSQCFVQNHRPICSCKAGYEGNPHIACKLIGCRHNSECESGRACINGNCINPCIVKDPCGPNAECYTTGNTPQCRCLSGYRGNPYERCNVVGCRSNNDCPHDRSCINAQCIDPCAYEHPCAAEAQCKVQNHIALCRCPIGMTGNPYTYCQEEERPECKEDSDCPAFLACFNKKCQNPCAVLEPCQRPSKCEVENTLPMRTMICVCPSGYVSSGSGTCKTIPPVTEVACTSDSQCPSDRACINGICINPCDCGPNAECHIKNHKPVCSCIPGYEGNPNLECVAAGCKSDSDCSGQHVCRNRACVPACAPDGTSCGSNANCYGIQHRPVCECPPGLVGNPQVGCTLVTCKADSDCPNDRACINKKCANPCAESKECVEPAICVPFNHKADCACPPGYVGSVATGCEPPKQGCRSDSECPSQQACINEKCVNPCTQSEPCGTNAICTVFDTTPVKTMICECPPGYEGNAVVACAEIPKCPVEKGFIRDEHGNCVCPPGTALNAYEECRRCVPELGYKIDESGHCVCALERGLIVNSRGECVCPPEHGYELDYFGNCIPRGPPGCDTNDDCPDHLYCLNRRCENPCEGKICGINAYCNATNHQAICNCPPNHHGNPEVECMDNGRKDFPKPEMVVSCLSDGVQVRTILTDAGFNGVLYVKGHSKEEECRRLISVPQNAPSRIEIFKVLFGSCGLIHVNGQASFVLVIQKHPKLVTYKAQAYHIKCVYATSEQNVTIGFNVSMLTTAGTIANTGPPPTCMMKIVTQSGQEISSAEIGENLMLQVDVHPTSIYGGFARSCVAKTLDNNVENEYIVTDENGCATEPSIFGEWQYNPDTQSLTAEFNAFKFPSSDNIRFQCNIRVCFGRCQPVNCHGYDAYGRRRKREISNGTDIDVLHEGQLREEITIESNAIFTVERREERLVNPTEQPQTAQSNDICISIIGLIVALIITALLALVAVAVSVSCWLMAYRRTPSMSGPLPHPTEFPNPIFSNSQPVSESNREYLA